MTDLAYPLKAPALGPCGEAQAEENGPYRSPPPQQVLLIEVGVFLLLIVPSMVLSMFSAQQRALTFPVVATANILQNLALLGLVLFFLWRNGERFQALGWTFHNGWREVLLGIGLFFPFLLGVGLLKGALQGAGFSAPALPPAYLMPSGGSQFLLALVFLVVVAVAEETIFRGYLILRFRALTHSPMIAVLLATALFSLGHGYQGSAGLITVVAIGLVFAGIYLWRGSLIAPMVMHFMQNFIGVILIPLQIGT